MMWLELKEAQPGVRMIQATTVQLSITVSLTLHNLLVYISIRSVSDERFDG